MTVSWELSDLVCLLSGTVLFSFDTSEFTCYARDMTTPRAERYSDLSAEYLRQAKGYLAEGDLSQASEKGWGAAATAVKAVAAARGMNHSTHRQLHVALQALARETGDDDLRSDFGHASELHINFYENWLDVETVTLYLSQVERLLERLSEMRETS